MSDSDDDWANAELDEPDFSAEREVVDLDDQFQAMGSGYTAPLDSSRGPRGPSHFDPAARLRKQNQNASLQPLVSEEDARRQQEQSELDLVGDMFGDAPSASSASGTNASSSSAVKSGSNGAKDGAPKAAPVSNESAEAHISRIELKTLKQYQLFAKAVTDRLVSEGSSSKTTTVVKDVLKAASKALSQDELDEIEKIWVGVKFEKKRQAKAEALAKKKPSTGTKKATKGKKKKGGARTYDDEDDIGYGDEYDQYGDDYMDFM